MVFVSASHSRWIAKSGGQGGDLAIPAEQVAQTKIMAVKYNHNRRRHVNAYFWRTYDRAELDYLEEEGGRLVGFECKWTATRWRPPAAFTAAYAESETHLVNRTNYLDFLTA